MSWTDIHGVGDGKNGGKKNQQDRSRKLCICGGHNASNAKRNLCHHSTKTRISIRSNRRFKEKNKYV